LQRDRAPTIPARLRARRDQVVPHRQSDAGIAQHRIQQVVHLLELGNALHLADQRRLQERFIDRIRHNQHGRPPRKDQNVPHLTSESRRYEIVNPRWSVLSDRFSDRN
jgi:hypothetical protein